MNDYSKELFGIADDLARTAENIRALALKMKQQSIVQSDKSSVNATQNTMSVADFRKVIAPYFKLDRDLFQKVLAKFNVKSITEVNAESYDSFIKSLEEEFKGDAA